MNPRIERLLLWLPGILAIAWFTYEFQPIQGMIGHDYAHQMVRFLIGAAHFWQNGFSVPHYTANLCGGIGVFADPQSTYYSIPQWLSFWIDPWTSVRITMLAFYLLGYWTFLRLCRDRFNLSPALSHFGSLLFITNGFAFAHLYVGHFTHHSYFLLPLFIDLLLRPCRERRQLLNTAAGLSLLLTYLLYSGGLHMFMVFAVTGLLLLPHWIERRQKESTLRHGLTTGALAGLLFLLAATAKFYAVHAYEPLFVIRGMDLSDESPLAIWLRYFWFLPWDTPPLVRWGEFSFGAWEYIGFVSKLTVPLLLAYAFFKFRNSKGRPLWFALATAVLTIEVALLAVGLGGNDFLPGFNHYHNPIKILAAFIPFICVLSALGLQYLNTFLKAPQLSTRQLIYVAAVFVVLAEAPLNTRYFTSTGIGLGFPFSHDLYQAAKSHGRLPPVKQLLGSKVDDQSALASAASNIHCYEPLFGYRGENLGGKLTEGPVNEVRDGAFNLTHPGCLIYPDYFKCQRWDRVPASESENMVLFTSGQTASWGVPPAQRALLYLALAAIASTFALWLLTKKASFKLKK